MAEYIDRKKYMKDKYNCDLIQIDNVELVPLYQIIDKLEQSIELEKDVIIIPDGSTNGDMIKAIFPDAKIDYHEKSDLVDSHVIVFIKGCDTCQDYSYEWWNAQYKREEYSK